MPRLFEGELPVFNIGTNSGQSCDPELSAAVQAICAGSGQPTIANGRFKGGYITRSSGKPALGVHAIQMELAMRAYLREPAIVREDNWPPKFDLDVAAPARAMFIAGPAVKVLVTVEKISVLLSAVGDRIEPAAPPASRKRSTPRFTATSTKTPRGREMLSCAAFGTS